MDKLVVIGGPGSGKTTVAREVAKALCCEHVELDELWWGPAWTPAGPDELRRRLVGRLRSRTRWVVDGNYLDEVADSLWPMADAIVWLDLPRRVGFRRTLARTAGRVITRRSLWANNRQHVSDLSPRSMRGLWRSWPEYPSRIAGHLGDRQGVEVVRLTSSRSIESWIGGLSQGN